MKNCNLCLENAVQGCMLREAFSRLTEVTVFRCTDQHLAGKFMVFHTIFFLFRCFGKSSFSFLWTLKSDE